VNALILNRESFLLPTDGWCQLAPLGEFPHPASGLIQVVDAEACEAMVARFRSDAASPLFPGLLVDFDHFSLDERCRSEAAGWMVPRRGLEPPTCGLGIRRSVQLSYRGARRSSDCLFFL
jgi:phage I-like protein